MQSATQPGDSRPPTSGNIEPAAGWLTDRPFLVNPNKKRVSGAFGVSLIAHLVIFLVMVAVLTVPAVSDMLQEPAPSVTYVFMPGPGGGGGGSQSPEPPAKAEVPTPKPPVAAPTPVPTPVVQLPPQVALPPISTQAQVPMTGSLVLSAPAARGGGSTGRGTGIGEGTGSGVGQGEGGGTGGGVYRPGSLVTNPEVIFDPKPAYTADAMRAKIQGVVLLEAVVRADGSLADIQVVRSLDRIHGLDQKAIETVRKWRFRPGRLKSTNEPVDIVVTIELTFTLR